MKKEINHKETDNRSTKFTEQEAPEKNTDNAYVKVGRDGQPEMPEEDKQDDTKEERSTGNR